MIFRVPRRRLALHLLAALCAVSFGSCAPRAWAQEQTQNPAAPAPDQSATISGHVFRADTGAPLGKAIVTIEHAGVSPSAARVMRTDSAGAYRFTDLEPGTYTVTANHAGFFQTAHGQEKSQADGMRATWVHVEAGQSLSDIDVSLPACTPQMCPPPAYKVTGTAPKDGWIVSGTMLDEDGDPFDGYVETVHVRYFPGGFVQDDRRGQVPIQVATDDQGNFQITGTAADTFYLAAIGVGAHGDAYTIEYYPNALSFDSARKFDVSPGVKIQNVHVVFKTIPTYTIRGKIVVADGSAAKQNYAIVYRNTAADPTGWIHGVDAAIAHADGSFTIRGLQPGEYSLVVGESRREVDDGRVSYSDYFPQRLGEAHVRVTNSDVQLTIPIGDRTEIDGTIILDGEPGTRLVGPSIVLGLGRYQSGAGAGRGGNGQVIDGEHFKLGGIVPGTYTLQLGDNANVAAEKFHPPNGGPLMSFPVYIKHVECGGVDYTEKPIEIVPGVALGDCQVTLARNPGAITGVVELGDKPAQFSGVILIPQSAGLRQHPDCIYTAETRMDGSFAIPRVTPGDYFIFAFPPETTDGYHSMQFADLNRAHATAVTIRQGETANVNLQRFDPR
jgi:hypothetical protein